MSQSTLTSPEINKNLCEAFNCFAEATTEVEVKVGVSRTITVSVCNNCVKKFEEDNL